MSPFSLENKTILLTGASSGIGRAAAQLCARMGASIVACGRDAERLQDVLASLQGSGHTSFVGDLTDEAARLALLADLPLLDGCVFSAGVAALVPMHMVSQRHLDQIFSINYDAPVLLTKALLAKKKIRPGASLVYVTAISERATPYATGAYSGAKAALTATARTIGLEQAKQGIRVNCVSPGYVETPMLKGLQAAAMSDTSHLAPLGAIQADEVAAGIAYLLTPAARWVSRSSLVIDGGLSLHIP